ncbi:type I-E CRISPR-associated protein Cse1/CasA [Propionibacteriaceae bacterium G57]|uniref:type I-E CRISPR-associated protein Cse1/CasA n=1 Tax=Aestuariimicrobium sp. G57 TaxID=3418485 RepID=UPI003DA76AE2
MTKRQRDTNLMTTGFLKATDMHGSSLTPNLREVFVQAPTIDRLDGDLPTQDVAVLRLLIAIVLAALADESADMSDSIELWRECWNDWERCLPAILRYLDEHADEFDLAHPQRPFMQSADLNPAGNLEPGVQRLVPDHDQWFTTRDPSRPLDIGEAARWLLHVQSFDTAGIKTGQQGDPAVKGGRGYPTGYPAWAGNLGVVIFHGATLAQTILLNTPLGHFPAEKRTGWQIDTPVSSRKDQIPAGPAELFTWPNRRVRLHWGPDFLVRSAQVSYGDTLTPQNNNAIEPMSAWRSSENQKRKAGKDVLMPVVHDPTRQVWRGLNALLADSAGRPRTAAWLSTLVDEGILDANLRLRLQVVGMIYGPQNSSIQTVVDDTLDGSVAALTNPRLTHLAAAAAELAREGSNATRYFASRLAQATGADEEKSRDRAAVSAYAAIDPVFRQWLAELTMDSIDRATVDWQVRIRRCLLDHGQTMFEAAGDAGLRGRVIEEQLVTSLSAWSWFVHRIQQLTPLAQPTAAKE